MRKQVFLVFFISIVGLRFFAQAYTPLLNVYNEWKFTTCYFGCIDDKYYTDGDTLVDGNTYKILDGYHYISRTFLLREDVIEKKVYLKLANSTLRPNEFLLYDFSLSVGDSTNVYNPISPFPADAGTFILDSIVARPLEDGNSYRHFYLHPIDVVQSGTVRPVWIEGVGSLSLINAPGGTPYVNGVGKLSCFFKNEDLFYSQLDSTSECTTDYAVSIPTKAVFNFSIVNFNKAIYVKYNKDVRFEVSLYTLNGELLIQQWGIGKQAIDLSSYSKGLLLMQLKTEKGEVVIEKVINL